MGFRTVILMLGLLALPSAAPAQPPPFLFTLASGLAEPDGVAVDPTQRYVYVADKDHNRVVRYDLNGAELNSWGAPSCNEVAVSPSGSVYVMQWDLANGAIKKYSPQGQLLAILNAPTNRQLSYGIAVDRLGRVYAPVRKLTTPFESYYVVMDSTGTVLLEVPLDIAFPISFNGIDIAVDDDFNTWVLNYPGNSPREVRRYDGAGTFLGAFGSDGAGNGQFTDPRRLTLGFDGLIYVTDYLAHRVQAFTKTGTYQFQWAHTSAFGIDTDDSGHVYVSSHTGGTISKYGPATPLTLTVSPADSLTTSGTIGGPFPGVRQYRIQNTGADTVSFSATPQQNWIQVTGTLSGSLPPGDSAFVSVSIGSAANALPTGTHSSSVRFEQTAPIPTPPPTGINRYVRLSVTPPPTYLLTLSVTPADSVFSAGYAGGPFTPSGILYTITNTGADSVSYSIAESASWLGLTGSATGRLAPGGAVGVTAGLTAAADGLTPGRHTTTLDIQQSSPIPNQGATGRQRVFVLDVNPLPPSSLTVTPGDFSAGGNVGGPFFPSSASYRVTSASVSPVSYSVSITVPWLAVTGGGTGSVSAGDTATVQLGLTAAANALPEAVHTGQILIAQTGPQALPLSRSAFLAVGNVVLLEVDQILPATGLTTAFAGGTPDTVLLTGTLLGGATTVEFGGRPATVVWHSDDEDSLRAVLPWYPPGLGCAAGTTIPVMVTVQNGPFVDTIPFSYTLVKSMVPEQYGSIQAAVNASRPGVCISVAPGSYHENIVLGSGVSGITLSSRTQDLGETTIVGGSDFSPTLPAVLFDGTGDETVLTGFQILLGNTGVVIRNGAAPAIIRNYINNNFSSGDGGGVRVESGCAPFLSNNRIDLNSAEGNGGGLAVTDGSPILDDNNFNMNHAEGSGGGLYVGRSGDIGLYDIRLYGNHAGVSGGGACLLTPRNINGARLELIDNSAETSGGGLHAVSDSQAVTLDSLVVRGNRVPDGQGGGILAQAQRGVATVRRSSVTENEAAYEGGGIFFGSGTDVVLRESLIRSNQADSSHAGGIYVSAGAVIDIRSNTIRDNSAVSCGSRGGALLVSDFVAGTIDSNLFAGNAGWVGGGTAFGRKCQVLMRRNVVAWNTAPGNFCHLKNRAAGAEPLFDPIDTVSVAPGIFVDDSGVNIVNNTIHGNNQGDSAVHGGGIHGRRTGAFAPDWINNIVSQNSGWGIHAVGINSAAIIDYNLGHQNALGNFSSTIHIPGEASFAHNISGDPLYAAPSSGSLDFHLSLVTSAAVDAGTGPDDPDNTPADIGAFHFDQLNTGVPFPRTELGPLEVLSVLPNPFPRTVTISMSSRERIPLQVDIFDVAGRRLMSRDLDLYVGIHELTWDGRSETGELAPAGVYFCRLRSGNWRHVDKLVLTR